MDPREQCRDYPSPEMIRAFRQFNGGEYWHQHETLEGVWRAERDESIRNLYKGILQVGVGLHHLTKRNYPGTVKVLSRGIEYLKPYSPICLGIDIQRLINEASVVLSRVVALGPERITEVDLRELPQVHWSA